MVRSLRYNDCRARDDPNPTRNEAWREGTTHSKTRIHLRGCTSRLTCINVESIEKVAKKTPPKTPTCSSRVLWRPTPWTTFQALPPVRMSRLVLLDRPIQPLSSRPNSAVAPKHSAKRMSAGLRPCAMAVILGVKQRKRYPFNLEIRRRAPLAVPSQRRDNQSNRCQRRSPKQRLGLCRHLNKRRNRNQRGSCRQSRESVRALLPRPRRNRCKSQRKSLRPSPIRRPLQSALRCTFPENAGRASP